MPRSISIIIFLILVAAGGVLAQDDVCPALVQAALEYTDEVCSETQRNQLCYGNIQVEAVPQSDAVEFEFDSAGDVIAVADIQSLNLSAMVAPDEWGVALMQLQANLPETLPGQNVTMLLFGDVTLEAPEKPDEARTALQAFYFQSGVGDPQCQEAPRDGILVQSPGDVDSIELVINDVGIELGSTIFMAAQPATTTSPGVMDILVLEGQAVVSFGDVAVTAIAGTRVYIPLDDHLHANGAPYLHHYQDYEAFPLLIPISILPEPFELVPPVDPALIGTGESSALPAFTPCSLVGDTTSTIIFQNRSNRPIETYWMDYNCQEIFYDRIAPGQELVQGTYVTHPWRVRDAETGAVLAEFTMENDQLLTVVIQP